ncbi:MAG: hypothetical protein IT532_03025 [Burkholderiales bacterium]|nr:hypothetical protein [Burkholderiales bacterium]
MTALDRRLLGLVAAYALALALLPFLLSPQTFDAAFSETGPFERLSLLAWIGAAVVIIVRIRPFGAPAAAFTALYLLFAAREADLHKAFTTRSISKLNYYRDASIPLTERIVAGLIALAILCLIAYAAFVVVRFLVARRGLRTRAGMWLALGAGLLVLGKALDRSAAVLSEVFDVVRPQWMIGLTDAFEEGLELATPLLLALSAWISQKHGPYLRAAR